MELPGKSLLKAHQSGGESDGRHVAAMWGAVGDAGEKLQGIAGKGLGMVRNRKEKPPGTEAKEAAGTAPAEAVGTQPTASPEERLREQNRQVTEGRRVAEMHMGFSGILSKFLPTLAARPDLSEEQAEKELEKASEPWLKKYRGDGNSPEALNAMAVYQNGVHEAKKTVMFANIEHTKKAAGELIMEAERSGNTGLRDTGFSILGRYMTEEEKAAHLHQSDRRMQTYQVESAIKSDPLGMREALARPDFLKSHPTLTRDDVGRLSADADGAARLSVGGSVDQFSRSLGDGSLKNKDDIARLYTGKVPPHVLGEMEKHFDEFYDPARIQRLADPAYQNEKTGEMGRMLGNLSTLRGEDFERNYTAAAFTLSQLQDGPGKSYQMAKLAAAREGRAFRPADAKQAAFAEIDGYIARERGRNGTLVRTKTMDPVTGAVSYGNGRALGDVRADLAHPEDEDAAISRQREMDERSGEIQDKLSDFFASRKDLSEGEIARKVSDIHGEILRRNLAKDVFRVDKRPVGPPSGGNLFEVVRNITGAGSATGGEVSEGGREEAEKRLATQLAEARAKVDAAVSRTGLTFSEHEKDALASFTQDQGEERLGLLLGGRTHKGEIASGMLRYRNAGGRRSPALERRREAERALFLRGYEGRGERRLM